MFHSLAKRGKKKGKKRSRTYRAFTTQKGSEKYVLLTLTFELFLPHRVYFTFGDSFGRRAARLWGVDLIFLQVQTQPFGVAVADQRVFAQMPVFGDRFIRPGKLNEQFLGKFYFEMIKIHSKLESLICELLFLQSNYYSILNYWIKPAKGNKTRLCTYETFIFEKYDF